MRPANRSPLTPASLAAVGMQGADAKADGHCETQHSPHRSVALFLARVAIDPALAKLDRCAQATDEPQSGVAEASDLLDVARAATGRFTMNGPRLTGNRCQCPICGDYFGSVRGFDRHRVGTVGADDRRCLTEGQMLAVGWHRSARGFLLTPDARRAGASVPGPRVTPAAIGVQGVMR